MKISDQIKHEAETIINIAKLPNIKARDLAQIDCCIRELERLEKLLSIDYDALCGISEC